MTTATSTAIRSTTSGVRIAWVLSIEGCPNLVTDYDDAAQVADAYVDTDWGSTTALTDCLQISGQVEQELDPWHPFPEANSLTFVVQPDAADTLPKMVFGRGAGLETKLVASIDCNDTTIGVLRNDDYDASGRIWIGNECISYTAKGTAGGHDTFTGCTRGMFAPFKANTEANQRFGHPHHLSTISEGVAIAPNVTSSPRVWIGRWVALRAHLVTGGVLCSLSDATLVFAGRIKNIREQPNGLLYLDCDDWRSAIAECTLLREQWSARVAEGIYLRAGWRFSAYDYKASTLATANDLVVVASGASGANQINAGLTTPDQLADGLNAWFASEKAAGRLGLVWSWTPHAQDDSGQARSVFRASNGDTTQNAVGLTAPPLVIQFMGFHADNELFDGGKTFHGDHLKYVSPEEPYRALNGDDGSGTAQFSVDNVKGTFIDQGDNTTGVSTFPGSLGIPSTIGSTYGQAFGIIQYNGGPACIVREITQDTTYTVFALSTLLDGITGHKWLEAPSLRGVRITEELPTIKQIVVLGGSWRKLLEQVMASTGTVGYNHATYDVLDEQLGVGMPWELLGTQFVTTLNSVEQAAGGTYLVLTKPTKVTESEVGEFCARFAQLVFKDGTLKLASWGTPSTTAAIHAFTEDSKAAPKGTTTDHRTVTNLSTEFLCNLMTFNFDYVGGQAQTQINNIDPDSAAAYGSHSTTVDLINHYKASGSSSDAAEELAAYAASMMSLFRDPLCTLRRSVALPYFESVAPGDFCTINDNFARDPSTGARGLVSKPALVVAHRVTWGGHEIDTGGTADMSAEVDLLILPLDRITTYSPAADVASYDDPSKTLTCTAHAYSESSETADAARFPAGSKVRIVEIDPDDPTNPDTWLRTVDSQSGNDIVLTVALSAPAYSASKSYRVISDSYTNAVTAQQSDVYQADDADGMIADTLHAYTMGQNPAQEETYTDENVLAEPALYAQLAYGDGVPLDTGYERDIARLCNNLVNKRTAPLFHTLNRGTKQASTWSVSAVKAIVAVVPVYFGPGDILAGDRHVRVLVWFKSSDGSIATVTVSLCRHPPLGSASYDTDTTTPSYVLVGPTDTQSVSTTTSANYVSGTVELSLRVIDPASGEGFIVVEVNNKAITRGIAGALVLAYDEAA